MQHLTNLEKQTDEVIEKMSRYNDKVKYRLDAVSASTTPPNIATHKILGIEDESEEFLREYNRVISCTDLPDVDANSLGQLGLGEMNISIWK